VVVWFISNISTQLYTDDVNSDLLLTGRYYCLVLCFITSSMWKVWFEILGMFCLLTWYLWSSCDEYSRNFLCVKGFASSNVYSFILKWFDLKTVCWCDHSALCLSVCLSVCLWRSLSLICRTMILDMVNRLYSVSSCVRGSGPWYFDDIYIPVYISPVCARLTMTKAHSNHQYCLQSFTLSAPVICNSLPLDLHSPSISHRQFSVACVQSGLHAVRSVHELSWTEWVLFTWCVSAYAVG